MKIVSWQEGQGIRCGVVVEEDVFAFPDGVTGLSLAQAGLTRTLQLGRAAVESTEPRKLAGLRLLPPIASPSVRDFVAFEEHVEGVVKNAGQGASVPPEWYAAPTFYFANPHTLYPTAAPIAPPSGSTVLDFELEVAAIVGAVDGSDGRSIPTDEAAEHLFGFTVMNDWSARDLQYPEMKVNLGPCKGKDFATTIGPWIVTADEFAGRFDDEGFLPLTMSVSINGVEFGRDRLSNMGWPFAELVAYASRSSRVVPGDLLGSGTAGSGCLAEIWGRRGEQSPSPLRAGDVVTMTVEGIGSITNEIVEAQVLPPVARARIRPDRGR
ncbi:fumarylacetoacetate hydrolase family protein [Subtercola sp. YIM 133946]|uniref:fumarylacetoacetate hydrolase family protein n=1 Tax=Subtercola sp. YIM 133946 TaxID=3118909 RepID=UPI002F95B438